MRVLDVGCGPGRHVLELASRGITTHGIDISRTFVDIARSNAVVNATFERMDARHMTFDAEFDAIAAAEFVVIPARAASLSQTALEAWALGKPVLANARALATAMQSHGFQIVSGGTDNHLMLVDLRSKGLTGKVAEEALDKAGITVNKNTVPRETQSPFITSGIRLGTPAVTTRGMREADMATIAGLIDRVLSAPDDAAVLSAVKADVKALTQAFPLYPERS